MHSQSILWPQIVRTDNCPVVVHFARYLNSTWLISTCFKSLGILIKGLLLPYCCWSYSYSTSNALYTAHATNQHSFLLCLPHLAKCDRHLRKHSLVWWVTEWNIAIHSPYKTTCMQYRNKCLDIFLLNKTIPYLHLTTYCHNVQSLKMCQMTVTLNTLSSNCTTCMYTL